MAKVPRASLSITILGDEDYRVLMASRGGTEAFGVFVSLVIVGRERLQQGQARQLSGTNSLRFDNSTSHVSALACVTSRQVTHCLETLQEVAQSTGSEAWMTLDQSNHLVIRSFFKFNTVTGWGGARQGAGRKSSEFKMNSDDNQDEYQKESSRILSGSGSGISVSQSAGEPPMPDPHPSGVRPDPGGRDSAGAQSLAAWAESLGISPDMDRYDEWALGVCDYAPVTWVRALLENQVIGKGGTNRPSLPYLNGILRRWLNSGKCPPLEVKDSPRVNGAPPKKQPRLLSDTPIPTSPRTIAAHQAAQKAKESDPC